MEDNIAAIYLESLKKEVPICEIGYWPDSSILSQQLMSFPPTAVDRWEGITPELVAMHRLITAYQVHTAVASENLTL